MTRMDFVPGRAYLRDWRQGADLLGGHEPRVDDGMPARWTAENC